MTTFTIRAAKPEDAANVTALLEKSYATLMAADYDAPTLAAALPLIARANPKLLQAPTYYVAETPSGNLIGCGGWTLKSPAAEPWMASRDTSATSPPSPIAFAKVWHAP